MSFSMLPHAYCYCTSTDKERMDHLEQHNVELNNSLQKAQLSPLGSNNCQY